MQVNPRKLLKDRENYVAALLAMTLPVDVDRSLRLRALDLDVAVSVVVEAAIRTYLDAVEDGQRQLPSRVQYRYNRPLAADVTTRERGRGEVWRLRQPQGIARRRLVSIDRVVVARVREIATRMRTGIGAIAEAAVRDALSQPAASAAE